LLPLESTDSLGNFEDGNKQKTIANRDQETRRIPSRTMLRLTSSNIPGTGGLVDTPSARLKFFPLMALFGCSKKGRIASA
jgi:hypothetical protein